MYFVIFILHIVPKDIFSRMREKQVCEIIVTKFNKIIK